ncbi:peptidase M50 [Knoellia flava TL1]|uniref:Zinc metalloprotease n=2 Tax=Knoellia flava TaxID=913969 RepID=A0A8H9KP38_9MICO|nr:site-2 protease family protein [Knoellia flava]KGN30354.1 peptidase M50 [Knoellia flava TL1]GGB66669.1 peptidase M50 [Knoellia flava]
MAAPRETRSSGLVIARVGGVPVEIGASWLLLAAFITFLVGSGAPELGALAYVVGIAYAVSLLVSVLVHEGAHAATAVAVGLPVHRVKADLWGGHTAYDPRLSTPGKAALIAVVGPLANLALGAVAWVASLAMTSEVPERVLFGVAFVNVLLAVFNLLPGLPLDGGQLVDALVWRLTGRREKGLIAAGWTGRAVTVGVVLWFVVRPLLAGQQPSFTQVVWMALIGFFMWQGATAAIRTGQARQMLARGTVAQVVMALPVLRPEDPLAAAAATAGQAVVVDATGRPTALVWAQDAASVPRERWSTTPVSALARVQPEGWVAHTRSGDDLTAVVTAIQEAQSTVVVAVEDGRVLGVVSVEAVNRVIEGN